MTKLSDYAELKLLDHVVGKTAFTMPATPFIELVSVDVTDSMTGSTITPVSYAGYARLAVAGTVWNAAASGSTSNATDITFGECTGGTDTAIGWALCDAASNGNVIVHGELTVDLAISTGVTPLFTGGTPGDLVITAD